MEHHRHAVMDLRGKLVGLRGHEDVARQRVRLSFVPAVPYFGQEEGLLALQAEPERHLAAKCCDGCLSKGSSPNYNKGTSYLAY
jgi:hypothetical protein